MGLFLLLIFCVINAVLWTICANKETEKRYIDLLAIPIAIWYGLSIGLVLVLIF